MDDKKDKVRANQERDSDIIYSKSIRAGKRIYYLDVKKNFKDEMYVAITESKKVHQDDKSGAAFEKHKVFLFKEDFEKFMDGLKDVVEFIKCDQ